MNARNVGLYLLVLIFSCCSGPLTADSNDAEPVQLDSDACTVTPIASITGTCPDYPIPLPFVAPDVAHMTVYLDRTPLASAAWTSDGHTVRFAACSSADSAQHLINVSFGCTVQP